MKIHNICNFIEPHFHKNMHKSEYEIIKKAPLELLSHNRFDLAFKLFFLKYKKRNFELAREIYTEHIRALTLGEFKEPGNDNKNSIGKYIDDYILLLDSFKKYGFDSNNTVIPLSRNGDIANGAHRTAICIYENIDMECVNIGCQEHIYDYKFFINRGLSPEVIDIAATTFLEYSNKCFMAVFWPSSNLNVNDIEKMIPNIIYLKKIKFNELGAHNFLSQVYYGEEWLGSENDNFSGVIGKLVECFRNYNDVIVVAFIEDNLTKVVELKDSIRSVCNIGKHSIHITDTKSEAIRISRLVFNNNAIHFLNNSNPNRYADTLKKIEIIKKCTHKKNIFFDDIVIDSGMVLAIYGLRAANDIDCLCYNENELTNDIHHHDSELKYYLVSKNQLIYDPRMYFFYRDIKFTSLNKIMEMKKNRADAKDVDDISLIKPILENKKYSGIYSNLLLNIKYRRARVRKKIILLLKFLRIYQIIRNVLK